MPRHKTPPQIIVIFPDEDLAFDAYRFLQVNGISPENMVLVGEGFSSPEYISCLSPPKAIETALEGMVSGLRIGLVLAFVIGIISFYSPGLNWVVALLLVGATVVTTVVLGGFLGWLFGSYRRNHISQRCLSYLRQGQYLLLLEGSESLVRRGREILHSYGSRYDF